MGNAAKKRTRQLSRQENIHAVSSRRTGVSGYVETFLRTFRTLSFAVLMVPLVICALLVISLSLTPAVFNFISIYNLSVEWPLYFRAPTLAFALSFSYLLYGISIIFIAPLFNLLTPFKVKEWRGIWYSLPAISWFFHNAYTYLVRYTFLELVTPSPLNVLFYKMMGMKVGKGVVINTTNISDPSMIELGDYVTIGGSAHLLAHYGQKGFLVISKVKIGKGTTIGLKASVMGGVTIGEGCIVRPHSVMLPKSTLADGETV